MSDTMKRTYDGRFWQRGTAGSANIITFDGDDVVGVAYVGDATLAARLIAKQNSGMERAITTLKAALAAMTAERDAALKYAEHVMRQVLHFDGREGEPSHVEWLIEIEKRVARIGSVIASKEEK